MDELVELSEVSEELDEVSLLESDCEDESESEGSGSGLDLDLLDFFDRLGLGVFGLMSVKVVRNDMVSGKDDTDDVSSISVFSFLDFDLELKLVHLVLVFVRTILQEYMSLSKCFGMTSCLLLCHLRDSSYRMLDRFLIVEGAGSSGGKKA